MEKYIQDAHITGLERVAAWSDLLDQINVFPVADGDTGRNLITTLSPLRALDAGRETITRRLLLSARGNSGNIAALFFSGLLTADSTQMLPRAAQLGRDRAWQAVGDPVSGTMLDVMDALTEIMEGSPLKTGPGNVMGIIERLQTVVRSTRDRLPKLKDAGVVDSGALGIYIFLEGFLLSLAGQIRRFQPVTEVFRGLLHVCPAFTSVREDGYCVDMVVRFDDESIPEQLSQHGESVVVIPHDDVYKVHMHTRNRHGARAGIESLCHVLEWLDDDLSRQTSRFKQDPTSGCVHIMTDAAGSISRETARELGITLLDSYITAGDKSLPETLFRPQDLYKFMRAGIPVSSSQASIFERYQHYESALNQHAKVLYLCVGSFYTGNFDAAVKWKQEYDHENRFTVMDTGAASGRLATVVMATARFSTRTDDPDQVVAFARSAVDQCEEYVFLDKLQYLAAGGRLSKSSAFFGDLLHMKPIISPLAEGAAKVGVVRNQKAQLDFALSKLESRFSREDQPLIMLQYTDNESWVREEVQEEIAKTYPSAEILLHFLSLTSSVHMGPGTWSMAFLPDVTGWANLREPY
ncbi:MAG: DegV family protein [Thermodesulfobacteriota bacterium]